MKRKTLLIALLALVLVLGASIGESIAFFTTYTEAKGGYPIALGSKTEIHEEFSNWTKHVSIENTLGSEPVFVRVKAFYSDEFDLSWSDPDGLWTAGADGWFTYALPIEGGQLSSVLDLRIENVPRAPDEDESFNVIVVYEYTPVRYREDGSPYADWSAVLERGTEGGGN